MDTAPLTAQFLTKLQTLSPSLHACLTTTATIPTSLSPAEVAFFSTEAMRLVQDEFNAVGTGPYLSIVSRAVDNTPIVLNGQTIKSKERSLIFNEVQGAVDVVSPTSAVKPPTLL